MSHRLIWAVIIGAVLFLPLGNLAAASVQPAGCPHGHGAGPGLASGHCCCPGGMPGPCGTCGQGGMAACRCSSGTLAFISTPPAGAITWQGSPYPLTTVFVAIQLFPPNIFHPPELSPRSI